MSFGKHGKHSIDYEEEVEVKNTKEMGIHTIKKSFDRDISETITKIIDGSLRSGKRVEYEGSIVILGDVNNGAEVIAEENIIVMGKIRGLVHAGAKGNRKAIIVASEINAPQLRIADIVKEIEKPIYISEENEETNDNFEDEFYNEDIKTRAYIKDGEFILE